MDAPSDHSKAHTPPTAPPFVNREIPCRECGFVLMGLPFGARCPCCGTPVADSIRAHHAEDADSSLALLFGALALIAPILALLLGPVAIIFYARALAAYQRNEIARGAIVLATVGMVMGVVSVIVSIPLAVVLVVVLFG